MPHGQSFVYASAAYEQQVTVKNTGCVLYLLTGHNPGADCYVMAFDTTAALVAGMVPKQAIRWPGLAELYWAPSNNGRRFISALKLATSTTGDTYTPSPVQVYFNVEGRET